MEKVGFHKRDILVHRVEKARDGQQEAKEQFQSALEQFSALTNFEGGALEDTYKRLQGEYDESLEKANLVRRQIRDIEDVAEALFEEWREELEQYGNPTLRRSSEQKLKATRRRYQELIATMQQAEAKIDPVLAAFHDQVLFLKHNLNAQAIASLQSEFSRIETDIAALIKAMEQSIREANDFIASMERESG